MKTKRMGLLVGLVLLEGARMAAAAEPETEMKNELVVFGGASILDASRGQDRMIQVPPVIGDRWPGFPQVLLQTETSLEGSALFGARYSRYVKGRLAVEADFAVAPTHDLEVSGGVCLDDLCFGRGTLGPAGRQRGSRIPADFDLDDLRSRNLTAWHYGGGLAFDLAGGDVRPVIILGAGGVSYSGARGASTDFVLRFGAGLKVLFGRVGGRVEVVDHLVPDHFLTSKAEHDLHATAGFLVRF